MLSKEEFDLYSDDYDSEDAESLNGEECDEDKGCLMLNNDERKLATTAVTPKKIIKDKNVKKSDNKKFDFETVLNSCAHEEFDNAAKVDHLKKKIKLKKRKGK